jgi:nitrogen-specific signal transduction histidine kinase
VDVPAGLPEIQADHHQLTQLFTNLLINAYEAMDGGKGRVVITASTMQQDDGGEGREAVRIEGAGQRSGDVAGCRRARIRPVFHDQGTGLWTGTRDRSKDC